MKISLLINMKMPTIVGIFIFISRENFLLSLVEHEKKFYNLWARSDFMKKPHMKSDDYPNAQADLRLSSLFASFLASVPLYLIIVCFLSLLLSKPQEGL